MKCLLQQMKQIAATRHSSDHLWAGPWTLIWSASSWRTAAHSNKCSRMQPQSSSHYPPAQENAWSGEYAFSKNLHDRQQQSVTSVHRSTADQRAPSALLTGQTPHPHQKVKWRAWNRPCIRFSWTIFLFFTAGVFAAMVTSEVTSSEQLKQVTGCC